jgi:ferredoxin
MVYVNKETCIGCGSCVAICEEVFEMTDDGKVRVKAQKDNPGVTEAIEACPVDAIKK